MTTAELQPFLGRIVAVYSADDAVITGKLERLEQNGGPTAYHILSADGEVPPVTLDASEIVRVIG